MQRLPPKIPEFKNCSSSVRALSDILYGRRKYVNFLLMYTVTIYIYTLYMYLRIIVVSQARPSHMERGSGEVPIVELF